MKSCVSVARSRQEHVALKLADVRHVDGQGKVVAAAGVEGEDGNRRTGWRGLAGQQGVGALGNG